ncbi:MAG: GNAT family N-acetyltransferase [Tepidisphaeraceae bacterium]
MSNLSGQGVVAGRATLRRAAPQEQMAALGLALSSSGRVAGEREVAEFLRIAGSRHLDLSGLWIAEEGGKLLWAILPVATPGKTLLLLSPNYLADASQLEPALRLTEVVCGQFPGIDLAQVLVEPTAMGPCSLYPQLGFMEIAELIYLHAPVRRQRPAPPLPAGFSFAYYSEENRGLFITAIRESYQQSLDCPALNGLREIDDVLIGHQAAGGLGGIGDFDPSLWRVLLHQPAGSMAPPQPCGVLLLCRTDHNEGMELVYIGLSPHVRRRGLGSLLVQYTLATAAAHNRHRVTLAVDSRNSPALHVYFRHGFQKIAAKVAFIRDLRKGNAANGLKTVALA